MESWEHYNYYTRNNTLWVKLMNYSTAEWGIGWLPSNVVAIPGLLNSSWNFPPGTIVIEKANIEDLNDKRTVESIAFGITSAIGLLWAALYLLHGKTTGTLFRPKPMHEDTTAKSSNPSTTQSDSQLISNASGDNFKMAEDFKRELLKYYETVTTVRTELEIFERDASTQVLEGEDVEAVTELVRKMYELDMELWSSQSQRNASEQEKNEIRMRRNAILAEVKRIIGTWEGIDWTAPQTGEPGEQWQFQEIKQIVGGMPNERHG